MRLLENVVDNKKPSFYLFAQNHCERERKSEAAMEFLTLVYVFVHVCDCVLSPQAKPSVEYPWNFRFAICWSNENTRNYFLVYGVVI